MMKKILLMAVMAVFIYLGPVLSQELTLEGDWWVTIKGKDKGAAELTFDNLLGGIFDVQGHGITVKRIGEFFAISEGQSLQGDALGNISGNLLIEDLSGDPLGEFSITKGTVNKDNTRLDLKGTLTVRGDSPVKVKLVGIRFPEAKPLLTGRDVQAQVKGKGLKSHFYDVTIDEEPDLGFPFFTLNGTGDIIVKGPLALVGMDGLLIASHKRKGRVFFMFGTFSSPELGDGLVTGKLKKISKKRTQEELTKVSLKITGDRNFKLTAILNIPIAPIILVTPTHIDYGEVKVGESKENTFNVKNDGVGTLAGEATISDPGFTVVGDPAYDLGQGESKQITIRFTPGSEGTFDGTVRFTGGGGATATVTGKGIPGTTAF